uniref:Putative formin-like protein 5 n=1 Tax=Ixodes ricinus TaxID=34613 RepID=A0A6B0V1Y5_IXORI
MSTLWVMTSSLGPGTSSAPSNTRSTVPPSSGEWEKREVGVWRGPGSSSRRFVQTRPTAVPPSFLASPWARAMCAGGTQSLRPLAEKRLPDPGVCNVWEASSRASSRVILRQRTGAGSSLVRCSPRVTSLPAVQLPPPGTETRSRRTMPSDSSVRGPSPESPRAPMCWQTSARWASRCSLPRPGWQASWALVLRNLPHWVSSR